MKKVKPLLSHLLGRRLCGLVVMGLLWGTGAQAADWSLAELMQSLAQKKSAKASFVEKKYLSVLDQALESSGELSFDAPDRLEKRTLKPHPEVLLLEGDNLTVTLYNNRPIYLRLQQRPDVAALVDSIRATLSGDLAALEKNYSIQFSGGPGKWQLTLTPLQKVVCKVISQIRMTGAESHLKTISFEQADGDRSEMTISKVATP